MWLVTTNEGTFKALLNPTRGCGQLEKHLIEAGFMAPEAKLEGQGVSRRVTYAGQVRYLVVQLPRTMGKVLTPQDLYVAIPEGSNVDATPSSADSNQSGTQSSARVPEHA